MNNINYNEYEIFFVKEDCKEIIYLLINHKNNFLKLVFSGIRIKNIVTIDIESINMVDNKVVDNKVVDFEYKLTKYPFVLTFYENSLEFENANPEAIQCGSHARVKNANKIDEDVEVTFNLLKKEKFNNLLEDQDEELYIFNKGLRND